MWQLYRKPFVILGLPRPAKGRRLPAVLGREEVLRIFECVANPKHRLLLMLAYSAGLRVGEVVRVRLQDIDMERKLLHVRSGKGNKDRYTLLSEVVMVALRGYVQVYRPVEFLFEGGNGRRHLSERSAQHIFERAVRGAGIQKDVSIHVLRHSLRRICWRRERICDSYRSCWGIRVRRRRRCICM